MGSARQAKGFTLIEVMIVVAMIAIIATIAVGSYRDNVVRANRAAAASYILEVANLQERFLLDNRAYAASMLVLGAAAPAEVSNNYTITTTNDADADGTVDSPPAYLVRATPNGAQASDDTDCGWLQITNLGAKTSQHSGARCWR